MAPLIVLADARDISRLKDISLGDDRACDVFLSNPFQKVSDAEICVHLGSGHAVSTHYFSDYPHLSSPTQSANICTQVVQEKLGHLLGKRSANPETFLLDSQANMIALDMRPIASLAMTLCALMKELDPDTVYLFGPKGRSLTLPQRPDISRFFRTDLFLNPVAEAICQDWGIKFVHQFSTMSSLGPFTNFFRDKILGCYKFVVTFRRLLASLCQNKPSESTYDCAILIRSESEYSSARPILQYFRQHEEETGKVLLIQDDIIRHPSARKILAKSGEQFLPIHTQISIWKMVRIWIDSGRVLRKAKEHFREDPYRNEFDQSSNLDEIDWALHFLSRPEIFAACVDSSLKTSPEILIFREEMSQLVTAFQIKSLLTCDMIDKWTGAIGSLGRELPLRTFTLQNASVFQMFLPKPNSTDYFFVASETAKRALNHGHSENNDIVVTGLPMYEEWKKLSDSRPKKIWSTHVPRKLIIGTQPFAGGPDLNFSLIRDTCECLPPEHNAIVQVKIHPRERKSDYKKFIQSLQKDNFPVVLLDQVTLEDVFLDGDIYVSRTSTTLLTSLFFRLIALAYVPGVSEYEWKPLDYLNEEAPHVVQSKKELSDQLAAILDDGPEGSIYRRDLLARSESIVNKYAGEQTLAATASIVKTLLGGDTEEIGTS